MIVWSGRGFLPLAFLFAGGVLAQWLAEDLLGVPYQGWPVSAMLVIAGALSFAFGRAWNHAGRPAAHTLFWIPLQWWGPLLVIAAVANLVVRQ